LLIDFKGVREPVNRVPQKKTEKRKLIPQGRREGMSGFLLKILPEARGWRFLIKPAGPELDRPGRRLIFAFLFWLIPLSLRMPVFKQNVSMETPAGRGAAIWRSPKYIMPVI